MDTTGTDEGTNTTIQHRGESAAQSAKKTAEEEMADEAESFAKYKRDWESSASASPVRFFDHETQLSSMQFTHYTPGHIPYSTAGSTPETLQIISIKLVQVSGGLELPLSVYGEVAVRDAVDGSRNILFDRDIREAQQLKHNDPFLRLTGPSRAVVFTDAVDFEFQLYVKGTPHKALINRAHRYMGEYGPGVSTICFKNVLCTLELCVQPVRRTVQATILSVQVVRKSGSWPLEHGGLVACCPHSGEFVFNERGVCSHTINRASSRIMLLESKDRAIPRGWGAYVDLPRKVVSVEVEGALNVIIQAYSKSGVVAKRAHVRLMPKFCGISEEKCALGAAQVTINVAWSLVPMDSTEIVFGSGNRKVV